MQAFAVRVLTAAALAASAVAAAAVPMTGAHPGARPVLAAAVACAALAVIRLAIAALAGAYPALLRGDAGFLAVGLAARAWSGVLALPWAEAMTVAVLALEALHPARPWHTVALGVVVVAFLLALHIAESGARLAVLRPHLPLLAAGLALATLSAAAATLSAGGGLLAVIAAAAALAVAALALPV